MSTSIFFYLKDGSLRMGDNGGRYLNFVESLEELRCVVVGVVDRHHHARTWWQDRIAIVHHHHLQNRKLKRNDYWRLFKLAFKIQFNDQSYTTVQKWNEIEK